MAMNNLYGELRLRPTRIGFLVPTTNRDVIRSAMQICACIWGGRYNPIIPVDENVPAVWHDPIVDKFNGIYLAKGYVDFFEPDIFVESEPGLAQKIGLQPTEIDFGLSRIVPLAAFSEESTDRHSRVPVGLSILDVYRTLYETEFRFMPKHGHQIVLMEGNGINDGFVDAAFGTFPSSGVHADLKKVYVETLGAEVLPASANAWLRVFQEQLRTPLTFSRHAIKSQHHGFGEPILFVLDPASPLDLIDYWNIRLYEPNVLPVNVNWISETRDFLHEFIKCNHRPLPGNQHGVMIHTTVQFGRSISKERAEAIVADERFGELPQGSWLFKLWYDRIWVERDDNDTVFRPKRTQLTAGSSDLEMTVSDGATERSIRFRTLSPDFARSPSDGPASWVNVLRLNDYGTHELLALALPTDFIAERMQDPRMGGSTIISREGFVLPQRFAGHSEYFRLASGRDAICSWLTGRGVKATVSKSGRVADQVLVFLGGIARSRLIADRDTLRLLDDMAKSVRRYADGTEEEFGDRAVDVRRWKGLVERRRNDRFSFGIGLESFISANILKLGIALSCPNCSKENWYGLDGLREEVRCEQCLQYFKFPQGTLNFDRTPWQYRVNGPFSVPGFADGAYATVLTLDVFKDRLGAGRATLTYSTGIDLEFDADTKREIDFVFWYQKEQLVEREDRLQLVFGEAKSFGREAFDEKDVDTMERLAAKFPGSFFVFSTLKDELSDAEKAAIAPFATSGRKRDGDGRPRAPVIVLTGRELFASWYIEQRWKDLGGRHAAFVAHRATQLSTLQNLADFTQQLYLGLPDPYAELRARLGNPRAAAQPDTGDQAPCAGNIGSTTN